MPDPGAGARRKPPSLLAAAAGIAHLKYDAEGRSPLAQPPPDPASNRYLLSGGGCGGLGEDLNPSSPVLALVRVPLRLRWRLIGDHRGGKTCNQQGGANSDGPALTKGDSKDFAKHWGNIYQRLGGRLLGNLTQRGVARAAGIWSQATIDAPHGRWSIAIESD